MVGRDEQDRADEAAGSVDHELDAVPLQVALAGQLAADREPRGVPGQGQAEGDDQPAAVAQRAHGERVRREREPDGEGGHREPVAERTPGQRRVPRAHRPLDAAPAGDLLLQRREQAGRDAGDEEVEAGERGEADRSQRPPGHDQHHVGGDCLGDQPDQQRQRRGPARPAHPVRCSSSAVTSASPAGEPIS